MEEWKIIWNSFCDIVAESIKKKHLEKVFEDGIARDFFTTLGWNRFKKELKEQLPVQFATATHKADFALFTSAKENPEVIIELKRPNKKKEEKDAKQLIDYMKQTSSSYGILLLGDKLEIYYIDYSKPQHEAMLVETVKYQHNNDAARQFMEVLNRDTYESAHMLEYCHKRVKINKSVEYWCSQDGKQEILNMIVEHSQLPEPLQETLRTTLMIEVKRKDGLIPVSQQPIVPTPVQVPQPAPVSVKTQGRRERKVWMVPASPKYFDHKGCFDELGHIYWKQFNNFQEGDIGYIYMSAPVKCVIFKFEVTACNLALPSDYQAEKKFYKKADDFEDAKKHNRFYNMKRIGEHTSGVLTLANMKQNGLKGAPMGTLNLSDKSFEQLLAYIEQNF